MLQQPFTATKAVIADATKAMAMRPSPLRAVVTSMRPTRTRGREHRRNADQKRTRGRRAIGRARSGDEDGRAQTRGARTRRPPLCNADQDRDQPGISTRAPSTTARLRPVVRRDHPHPQDQRPGDRITFSGSCQPAP